MPRTSAAVPVRVTCPPSDGGGKGACSGPHGRRASVPVAVARSEGVVTRGHRSRDDGSPCRRWLGRDPQLPGRGSAGLPVASPCASRSGVLSSSAASARRPSASTLSRFVRPSSLVLVTECRPGGPARLPLLSPSGASDRSEGNFRRPEGWKGGRPLWLFSAPCVPSVRGRRAARPRPGPAVSRSLRLRVRLFPRRQFPSPNTWAGYPRRCPARVGGGSKPRAASRGEAGDWGAPPRLPKSPPAAAGPPERRGPGPSRAPGLLHVVTQLCLVFSLIGLRM